MLVPFMAFAQNGVYTVKFGVTVRNLPRYYVQPQSRNYSLVCAADRQVQHHVSFDQISDELHFAGWKRLSSPTNAYMKININLKSMLIDGFGVKENIIDTRDRFGHPIKVHTFQGVINYTMVTTWTVRTPSENFSSNPNVSYAPKAFTPEREFDTPGAAMDYVRNLTKFRGFNIAQVNADEAASEIQEESRQQDNDRQQAYEMGREAADTADTEGDRSDADAIVLRLREAYGEIERVFADDAEMRLDQLEDDPW
jgi:hypothetical protein